MAFEISPMDRHWKYSQAVEPATAQATGCFTTLPIRIHERDDIANEATLKSIREWGEHVGDGWDKKSGSALSPVGNWCSFIFPESLPDRLGVITYLANMGNIHDDSCEEMDLESAIAEHNELSTAMDINNGELIHEGSKSMKFKRLISECLLECIEYDRQKALGMLESYRKKWLDVMEHPDIEKVQTIEEYLTFRNLNGGMEPFWLMCQFGMDISISAAEEQLVRHIFIPAEAALVMTNDYWSWNREYELSKKTDAPRMVNSIDLLMRTKSLSLEEAREAVKEAIVTYEAEYVTRRSEFYQKHPDISLNLRRYIEVCGVVVAGNHYWCANCPRHNSWRQKPADIQEQATVMATSHGHGKLPMTPAPSESGSDSTSPKSSGVIVMSLEESRTSDLITTIPPRLSCSEDTIWKKPSGGAIALPVNYINSLPSKRVRSTLVEALNLWFRVPFDSLRIIENIIDQLHNASLILDDIEDNSPLRRGNPAVHTIFGQAQSINSANFMYVQAVKQVCRLKHPGAVEVLLEELECLYLGQSWDLHWKFNLSCPSEREYMTMVDNKTGRMFRMIISLMEGESPHCHHVDFTRVSLLLGRFFQVRDDYMNLQSGDYSDQKGFCEDLDEGKFSYPIVYCMENYPELGSRILGIFRQRISGVDQGSNPIPYKTKLYIVNSMEAVGSFTATLHILKKLETELDEEVRYLEKELGVTNPTLRLLLATLTIKDLPLPVGKLGS